MWQVGLAFLLGHCCIHSLPALPSMKWTVAALLCTAAILARFTRLRILAACFLGMVWAGSAAERRIADDLPARLEGEDVVVVGDIASIPHRGARDRQFLLDVLHAEPGVTGRIRLTWYRAAHAPQPGERWQFVVRLKRRSSFANPGGVDQEAHLFRQGITATGYVREDGRNQRLAGPSPRYAVTRVRAWVAERISLAAPGQRLVGVLQGLAIGDTQAIDVEQWRVFAATGTTHIMAISGLHISMIAALAATLGGAIVRLPRAQTRRWSVIHGQAIAGLGAAAIYSVLAGLSIPTQRTLLMLGIYFASRWCRRELAAGHLLGLALIGVLLIDPFAPLAPGAWLSFGAVAIILITVAGRIARRAPITDFARVQLAITVGLVPLLASAFGSVSLVSPVANAIAVPLFTLLIVPSVLLGAVAAVVWLPAGEWILAMPLQLLEWSWPLLQWLADRPMALWYFVEPSALALGTLGVGALLLLLPGIFATRVAGVLLCMPVILNRPPVPAAGDFELAALDVGQGLAVVVRTHAHALLFDAGPAFQSGRDAAELAVLPYLRRRGVRQLDALVISHGDLDHQGGAHSVLSGMRVRRIIAGPSVRGLPGAGPCRKGERWNWDGVQFEILHPDSSNHYRENDSSCVLRIGGRAGSALLTGDIEAEAEAVIAEQAVRSDIVVVPHHGSRTSSTARFVAAAAPSLALISAGYRNRWGMPQPEVRERWHAAGARTLTTADSGAIEVSFAPGRPPHARAYRQTHRRYWQR